MVVDFAATGPSKRCPETFRFHPLLGQWCSRLSPPARLWPRAIIRAQR